MGSDARAHFKSQRLSYRVEVFAAFNARPAPDGTQFRVKLDDGADVGAIDICCI